MLSRKSYYFQKSKTQSNSGNISPQKRMEIQENNPILQLHAEIEQIQMRQKELKILIQAEKLEKKYGTKLEENINEKILDLANEYRKKCESTAVQDTIIPTLQLSDTLYKHVIACKENTVDDELENPGIMGSKKLSELLQRIAGISSETVEARKEIKALEDDILQTQLKIHQVSSEKLQLLKKLDKEPETMTKKPDVRLEIKISSLKEDEEKLNHSLHIINKVLQKVIAFSGINWAQNDELKKTVLSAGKPLESQLSELET